MTTATLLSLRQQIARLGDYENSSTFTSTFLNEWINKSLEEYQELVIDAHEGYYDKTSDAAPLVTVAGTQTVNLPTDFLRLRLIERVLGVEEYTEIRRLTLLETTRIRGRGAPRGYMLHGASGGGLPGRVKLWPVPDGVYTIRLTYVPTALQLVDDADTYDFLPGGDVFVIYNTLIRLDERDGASTADRIAARDSAAFRIRGSAPRRDEGEPEYLVPRSSFSWSEDDE